VQLARRFFNGRTAPWEFLPTLMRLGGAYDPHTSLLSAVREMFAERRSKLRPQAQIFGFSRLTKGWTVMDRLGQITVPTLVMAGRDDFLFPRAASPARGLDPQRAAPDHRTRRPQPAPGADLRSHRGRYGLHLRDARVPAGQVPIMGR
jgi:pimeloyl-ACP methyl ester carboxylesterase